METKTSLNPYLIFNGNCREAMTYYKECLGGKLDIMNFDSAPGDTRASEKDNVLHANLHSGAIVLMASDSDAENKVSFGNNMSLSVNCSTKEEADRLYNSLANGGKMTMPLQNTFWGAYFGMLTDKFGINWMFNYDEPKK